jgi:hypothetical protein
LKHADAATARGRPWTIIPERHATLQLPRSEGEKRRPWTKIPERHGGRGGLKRRRRREIFICHDAVQGGRRREKG